MTEIEEKREILKKTLVCKGHEFTVAFKSSSGEEVLKYLKQEFIPQEMAVNDATQTIINAARRDVIDYIERLIKIGEGNVD